MKKLPTLREIKQNYRTPRDEFINMNKWERYISGNIAVLISKFFLWLPFTPNQVTLLWMLTAYIGCGFFALSQNWYWYGILGFIFMQLAFVLDCVDGIVARHKKIFSDKGDYIDIIGHRIQFPLMIFCIALAAYFKTQNFIIFIFSFVLILFFELKTTYQLNKINIFLVYRENIKSRFLNKKSKKSKKTRENASKFKIMKTTYSVVMAIIQPMTLVNMAGIAAIFNIFEWYIIIYAIIYPICVIPLLIYESYRGYGWVQEYVEKGRKGLG